MNLYKYLFGYRIEMSTDCLTDLQVPENYLERRFMREYLWKDAYFAIDKANILVKICYDSKHRWEEF